MSTAALSCPELRDLICRRCDRNTLTQLSTTNHQMSYSALDVLWSSIESLGPLIRCMPEDLWEERLSAKSEKTRNLSFCRPIRKTDWKRFLLNSARVQRIGFISGNITYELESDTYRSLCRAAADNDNLKLFPRLQGFDTRLLLIDSELASSYIPYFLSSTVTKLIIDLSTKSQLAMIPALINQCPFVGEAVLVGSEGNRASGKELVNTVTFMRHWSHLQVLSVKAVQPMVVLALSSLPFLKTLGVERIKSDDGWSPTASPNCGFPHLQHLVVDDHTTANFILQLMESMNQTPLISLEIHFHDRIPLDLWLDFLNTTARNIQPDHLQSVAIYFEGGTKFAEPISIKSIAPLLSFTHLKSVSFTSLLGLNFDDETVDAMARSWKNLEKLTVESFWQPQPRTTWKSLVSLAKHNPWLKELALPFDATTIINLDLAYIPWKDICSDALRMLDVRRSPIDYPSVVARFISDVFPTLEGIRVTPDLEIMDQKKDACESGKWAEVERLLLRATKNKPWCRCLRMPN